MSRRPRLGDVVEVEWIDSQHVALGWDTRAAYLEAIAAPQAYRTAGYWIGRRAGQVAIALSIDPANSQITHAMSIPQVAIGRITVLGRAHRRARRALR